MVFVQQVRFAHCQSGIETVEVPYMYVARMTGPTSSTVDSYVSTAMDGSFSHASRTNKLFKFEYVLAPTRVRPLFSRRNHP